MGPRKTIKVQTAGHATDSSKKPSENEEKAIFDESSLLLDEHNQEYVSFIIKD